VTTRRLKTLMAGLAFGESPRWHSDRLWLADWGAQEVIAVDLDGNNEVVVPGALSIISDMHRLAARRAPFLISIHPLASALQRHPDFVASFLIRTRLV
jgi:sugar lactone lactonase YvrE